MRNVAKIEIIFCILPTILESLSSEKISCIYLFPKVYFSKNTIVSNYLLKKITISFKIYFDLPAMY